jgi:hypothetical protein
MMTMTYAEADRIIQAVCLALEHQPSPCKAQLDAWKRHEGKVLYRVYQSKYRRIVPKALLALIGKTLGTAKAAGDRARHQVIQSHPVFGMYNPVQIDAALKLGVAHTYLLCAGKSVHEQHKFEELVKASNPFVLSCQGWFEMLDPSTMRLRPEWAGVESASSFAEYCKSIGENDPAYWRKVYDRLGLEYNSGSPQGNCRTGLL